MKKKKQSEEKREIKKKNYFILLFICLLTIAIAIGIRNQYIAYQNYQLTKSALKGKINEVSEEELYAYIAAHPDAILFVQVNEDANSRKLGKKLYKELENKDLLDEAVYINIGNLDKNNFYKDFNEYYSSSKKLNNYPAVVLFKDGKLLDLVQREGNSYLYISSVDQLLDIYEIEGM